MDEIAEEIEGEMIEDEFTKGVISMARSTRDAFKLVKSGRWTFEQAETWINHVIKNDSIADSNELLKLKKNET